MVRVPKLLAVAAVVAIGAVLGHFYGIGAFMLSLAAGVLLAVILMLWSSLQGLTGDAPLTFEEALSLGAVTPEEERKRAVIRTLKDLDYERTVGKISDDDFLALSAQYREEARGLLRSLDDELAPAREKAEALLRERLEIRGEDVETAVPSTPSAAPDSPRPESIAKEPSPTSLVCESCGGSNDADARFCKHCGHAFGATAEDATSEEEGAQ